MVVIILTEKRGPHNTCKKKKTKTKKVVLIILAKKKKVVLIIVLSNIEHYGSLTIDKQETAQAQILACLFVLATAGSVLIKKT